jgi:hypothetical protein
MRKVVRGIGVLSAGKIGAIIYASIGLVLGIVVALLSMAGAFAGALAHGGPGRAFFGMVFGVGAIVVLPIFYGILGCLVLMFVALVYNVAAGIVGGLEFEIEDR